MGFGSKHPEIVRCWDDWASADGECLSQPPLWPSLLPRVQFSNVQQRRHLEHPIPAIPGQIWTQKGSPSCLKKKRNYILYDAYSMSTTTFIDRLWLCALNIESSFGEIPNETWRFHPGLLEAWEKGEDAFLFFQASPRTKKACMSRRGKFQKNRVYETWQQAKLCWFNCLNKGNGNFCLMGRQGVVTELTIGTPWIRTHLDVFWKDRRTRSVVR